MTRAQQLTLAAAAVAVIGLVVFELTAPGSPGIDAAVKIKANIGSPPHDTAFVLPAHVTHVCQPAQMPRTWGGVNGVYGMGHVGPRHAPRAGHHRARLMDAGWDGYFNPPSEANF